MNHNSLLKLLQLRSFHESYWRRGRVKLANCPLHGSQCKAQDAEVFATSHSGIPKLNQPKFIFV